MQAPEVKNKTEFAVVPHLYLGKNGEEILSVIKATFALVPGADRLELAPSRGVRFIDVPWGDPFLTPPQYPCDVVGHKPGTDVIVVARGHAPGGIAVKRFDVAVRVGPLKKALVIHGPRVWAQNGSSVSDARPCTEQEIRYDAAWGGLDDSDLAHIVEEARNPAGSGMTGDPSRLTHQPAPSIEDPSSPIRAANHSTVPGGFGPIGPHWQPRRSHVGTYDARWHKEKAPLLPDDHDPRANLCASPGLTATPPLVGGEPVELLNLTRGGGPVSFALPRLLVHVDLVIAEQKVMSLSPHLDTVLIDTLQPPRGAQLAVELVWRTLMPAPRRPGDAVLVVREQPLDEAA